MLICPVPSAWPHPFNIPIPGSATRNGCKLCRLDPQWITWRWPGNGSKAYQPRLPLLGPWKLAMSPSTMDRRFDARWNQLPFPWWCATCRQAFLAIGINRGLSNKSTRVGSRRWMANSLRFQRIGPNKRGKHWIKAYASNQVRTSRCCSGSINKSGNESPSLLMLLLWGGC